MEEAEIKAPTRISEASDTLARALSGVSEERAASLSLTGQTHATAKEPETKVTVTQKTEFNSLELIGRERASTGVSPIDFRHYFKRIDC